MYSKVVLAGTFDTLHIGHKRLINHALKISKELYLGITTDDFVRRTKSYKCATFEERKKNLIKFLGKKISKVKLFELDDEYGVAISDKDLQAIVVSDETKAKAQEINEIRERRGLKPLEVISLPIIYAQDLKKISCERITLKQIDVNGRRLKPVIISLGSTNKSKLLGVGDMAKKIFGKVIVKGAKIEQKVPIQPFELETIEGAIHRAIEAKRKMKSDYGVGIESGIFEFNDRYFDCTWCAVYDGDEITFGSSMCFEVEREIIEEIKNKGETMGSIFGRISGIKDIGEEKGAIGYLSGGMTQRKELNKQAFLTAMIPRISKRLKNK